MNRRRSVLAACGISAVLVGGSTAFALANGIFVSQPVDRVGSFQAMQARLVPETNPAPRPTTAGAPPPGSSARRGSSTTVGHDVTEPTFLVPGSAPEVHSTSEPRTTEAPEPRESPRTSETTETSEPRVETTKPARVPTVHATTTTAVAHSGPSAVPTTHDDDGHETHGTEPNDD